jgi:outer membrane lipoprotein-sorting protein
MSPNPPIPTPDDPVARATDALRRSPVPDGPPAETIARTLAALRAAAGEPGTNSRPRRRIMFTTLKAAAAVLVAAAVASYFAGFPPRAATAEFVEAARKLRDAQTLSLVHTQTQTIAGQPVPTKARILYKTPGLIRTEPEPAGVAASIFDSMHNKFLFLNLADKSAMLLEEQGGGPAPKRDGAAMMIEDMRRLAGKDNEPVGEKVIGDVRARGFRVKENGGEMTVWVDPQKKLPVLIEFSGRTGTLDYKGTFSDIRLDVELDDALFRLEPPAGYALRKANARIHMSFEEAVARWLRNYTTASGGRFPARLDDFDDYLKVVSAAAIKKAVAEGAKTKEAKEEAKTKEAKIVLDPAIFQDAIAGAQLAGYCQKFKDRYGYKADGVKLGDARAIIFWYKPEGQEKYKAVYGDLHIGEVTTEELPVKP